MLRERVADVELQEWIVDEVRRTLQCRGFAAELKFVRLNNPDASGATWEIDPATGSLGWSLACRDAFDAAVRHAQRAFDLID